jgi:hypothetical protein
MRAVRVHAALRTRLKRLESRAAVTSVQYRVRCGKLRRLPPDYCGEKHVVISKHLPSQDGQEWVEFEEVPGPEPNVEKCGDSGVRRINVMFPMPYPEELGRGW